VSDGIDIGGQSRRFQAAVIVVTMLVLLAGALAAATIDTGSLLDIGPGESTGTDGDQGFDGPVNNSSSADSGGGAGGDGGGGGGIPLPGFVSDLIGGGLLGGGEQTSEGETTVPRPPYNITVSPEPTPGGLVVVTVRKNGQPVPFAVVAVDGERVGRTEPNGQLVARVPYTTSMRVTARPPPEASGGLAGPPRSTRFGAPATGFRTGDPPQNSSVVYNVSTDIDARVQGVALPGDPATVQFSVAGNPLPGVNATLDGRLAGVTDGNGTVEVDIPADATPGGRLPLVVSRGEVENDTTVEIGELAADVETGLLALPGTGATVTVRAVDSTDERPLDGVPVSVTSGDEQVAAGRTDTNGTMSFGLPWSNSATATASAEYGTVSVGVSGIYLHLGGVVFALALPLVGVAVWVRRNRETRRQARNRVVGALVAAGSALDQAGRRVVAFLRRLPVARSLRRAWRGLARAADWLGAVLVAGGRRLAGGVARGVRWARGQPWLSLVLAGPLWLIGRFRAVLSWLLGLSSRLRGDETDTGSEESSKEERVPPTTSAGDTGPVSADERLRRYWQWLVGRVVGRSRARTLTPAEIERRALEKGLPAGAVRRLRRAFQDVEYGPANAEECVDDAESARERIREGDSDTDT
jgi:hypothetical protein